MKTILIVDDSRTARTYHASVVASAGYAVAQAADGAEGLERMFEARPDLVLTDVNMTGMDGYEFARRVRESAEFDGVPVVFVSTEASDADKARGFAAGADLYLVKPADPDALLAHVRMLLGDRP
jgi:two-component system chemotaxis response regulator CheY